MILILILILIKTILSDSFNLLVNNGAAAGQVIFHVSTYCLPQFSISLTSWGGKFLLTVPFLFAFQTHIHIIPRKERDCLWASEVQNKIETKHFERFMKVAWFDCLLFSLWWQSLRRHTLKLDKEASQLVSRVRQQLCSLPEEQLVQPS